MEGFCYPQAWVDGRGVWDIMDEKWLKVDNCG